MASRPGVSDAARAVQFLAGSDDGIAVWVNGAEVWRNDALRGCQPDEDVFPVTLREGPNPVLVKVKQVGSNWARTRMSVRGPDRCPCWERGQGMPIRTGCRTM